MARTKPKDQITTLTDAIKAMKTINETDIKTAHWEIEEAKALSLVKEEFAEVRMKNKYGELISEKKLLVKDLQSWAKKEEPKWKTKTLTTPFGRLGFRKSTPAVKLIKRIAKNFKEALEWLKNNRFDEYIRTVEEIDKDAILADVRDKEITNEDIEACGLKVDQKDEFWVESNAASDLDKAVKELKA